MAALLHCYLLLAALHIAGAFGSPFVFASDHVLSQSQESEELHLESMWDSDVLQHMRRFYHLNPPRFLKYYDNMKYHQSLFPAGWAGQKHRDYAQGQSVASKASTVSDARPEFGEGVPVENTRLDPVILSKANERSGHPALQQSVDAAQQGVMEREPIEMTKETLENSTIIESTEEIGHPISVDASENAKSEKEGEKGTDDTEETSTTEALTDSSRSEEITTDFVHDEVTKTKIPTTTDAVTKTNSSIYSTADSKHSTVDGRSSKEMSPSTTSISTTTVTVSETASSILSTAESKHSTIDGSSPNGTSSSTTHSPATTVTVSKTVSSILSTAYSKSSTVDGGSSSTTHFPATTVTVSPTPSTGTEETTTELVINMPKIRTAKIILSSVLLAIGLVAVAVMAVCIFRERRRKVKYDQLKLLP